MLVHRHMRIGPVPSWAGDMPRSGTQRYDPGERERDKGLGLGFGVDRRKWHNFCKERKNEEFNFG